MRKLITFASVAIIAVLMIVLFKNNHANKVVVTTNLMLNKTDSINVANFYNDKAEILRSDSLLIGGVIAFMRNVHSLSLHELKLKLARYGLDSTDLGFGINRYDAILAGGSIRIFIKILVYDEKFVALNLSTQNDGANVFYIINNFYPDELDVQFDSTSNSLIEYVDEKMKIKADVYLADQLGGSYVNDSSAHDIKVIRKLVDPFSDYYFGQLCGESGYIPEAKLEISRLRVQKKFISLLQIAKGYNPTSRIYAIDAIMRAKNDGEFEYSRIDSIAFDKVLNLGLRIKSCSGCLVDFCSVDKLLVIPYRLSTKPKFSWCTYRYDKDLERYIEKISIGENVSLNDFSSGAVLK